MACRIGPRASQVEISQVPPRPRPSQGTTNDEVPPGSCCIYQNFHEGQARVEIPNIELVIPKLASKTARDVRLQVTNVAALIHQMRWSDAHQPLEYSMPKGRSPVTHIKNFSPYPAMGIEGKHL